MTRTTMHTWLALLAVAVPLTGGDAAEPPRELPEGLRSSAVPLSFRAGMKYDGETGQRERLSGTTAAKPASGPYLVPDHLVSDASSGGGYWEEAEEEVEGESIEQEGGEPEAGELEAGELEAGELEAGELEAGELEAGELEGEELARVEHGEGEQEGGQPLESLDHRDAAVADPLVAPSSASLQTDRFAESERFAEPMNDHEESIADSASSFFGGGVRNYGGLRYGLMGCSVLCAVLLARKWYLERAANADSGDESFDESPAGVEHEELAFVDEGDCSGREQSTHLGNLSSELPEQSGLAAAVASWRSRTKAPWAAARMQAETPSSPSSPSSPMAQRDPPTAREDRKAKKKKTAKRATAEATEEGRGEGQSGQPGHRSRWRFLVPRASLSLPGCAARSGASPPPVAAPISTPSQGGADNTAPKQSTANSAGPAVSPNSHAPTVILLSQAAPAAALPTMVPGLSGGFPGSPYGVGFAGSAPGLGPSPWDPSARGWGGGGVWPPTITPSAYAHGMPAPQPYSVPIPYPTPAPPTVQIPVQVPIQVPVPVQIPVPVHVPIAMPIHYAAYAPHAAPASGGGDNRRDGNASSSS